MKILTANFITCAVKSCKSSPLSYPLHFRDAELELAEMEYNPTFLYNILPRLEWDALLMTANELGFDNLPPTKPEPPPPSLLPAPSAAEASSPSPSSSAQSNDDDPTTTSADAPMDTSPPEQAAEDKLWRDLHKLLLETQVVQGKMVCGNCGHEYVVKEGIANFLLPNHLV